MLRSLLFGIGLGVLAAADLNAQTPCYAENDSATFEDGASTSDATFAVRFAPPADLVVTRAEVFTGEVNGTMAVGIWSHDSTLDQPMTELASGNFACNLANDWQGADLSSPVSLMADTVYWLTWKTISGAQGTNDPPDGNPGQPFCVSLDDGMSWNGPFQSIERLFKFRLFCGCGAGPAMYGMGCDGTGGFVPVLDLVGCPEAGQLVTIGLEDALGGSSATFFFGLTQGNVPIGATGCSLLVSPLLPLSFTLPVAGSGGGNGTLQLVGTLPASASGVTFTMQAFIADNGVPRGYSNSNGLQVAIP